MKNIDRRTFIGKSLLGLGATALITQLPLTGRADITGSHPRHPVGFQVYTIREMLVKDFPGTLKMMAKLGYQEVEMCSPAGYITSGFEPLMKINPADMRKIIIGSGLTCASSHFTMEELKNNLDARIEFAGNLGLTQMIASSAGLPKEATMSDWLKAADQLNEMGIKTQKAGIQLGYHNHHMEFEKLEGELIYDKLLQKLDPDLVKMQFQVAVISIGYKAETYFIKYPRRFISAHLADWSATENKQVPVGKGVVEWKSFYNAAEIGGVKNYFVEMDMDKFAESVANINAM